MANPFDESKLSNPFLQAHLAYVADTESPRLMHIWSAVAGIAACMGRHVALDIGIGDMYANNYILLVGPPGTRKNAAISFVTKLLKRGTQLKLAPDDTGGQRQGLLTALTEADELDEQAKRLEIDGTMANIADLQELRVNANGVDKHTMFAVAAELGSFLGQNNMDMVRFLIKMWDGDPYTYQLRNARITLDNGLMTLLGGTTPTDISLILPAEAIGQGFMSRMVLVFGRHKERKVPRPQLNKEYVPFLEETYKWVNEDMHGTMTESAAAARMLDGIYMRPATIHDNRFIFYAERRHTHLIKLSMALAAARRSYRIDASDVREADYILTETEQGMPEALGEYGLSPLAVARQKMLEFIQHAGQPVHEKILWAMMMRDMKLVDFKNTIAALINGGKIQDIATTDGVAFVPRDDLREAISLLSEDDLDSFLTDGGKTNGSSQETTH